ncbi:LysR substrate-binding domain-containing protein, partial [Bacillus spizizenii]|uniref:LysR substrate-binding domain-containing protein n=1 Tax=Bacillus spizizenii TaxID=96241 RepID=UPI001F603A97
YNQKENAQLLQGKLDISFILYVNRPDETLHIESLIQVEIKMVAANDHLFPADLPVTLKDLQNETLLLTEVGCSYRTLFEN